MDSPTGFDDDDFFGSYDAEKAHAATSVHPHEFDDADDRPPTQEQLAHFRRFRKPVGLVVAAMSALSLVALAKRSSLEPAAERRLVAHYGSAIAAPVAKPIATVIGVQNEATAPSVPPDSLSAVLPKELADIVTETWSTFAPEAPAPAATVPVLVIGESDSESPLPTAESASTDCSAGHDSRSIVPFFSVPTPMCLLPSRDEAALDPCHEQSPKTWFPAPSPSPTE